MTNFELLKLVRKFKNIEKITVRNENEFCVTFKNKYHSMVCICYTQKGIIKRNKDFLSDTAKIIKKNKIKTEFETDLQNFKKSKNIKRDWFSISELHEFLKSNLKYIQDITYNFDLMGWLENFKITPCGFTAKDGTKKLNIFNNHSNKDYKFYLDELTLCL